VSGTRKDVYIPESESCNYVIKYYKKPELFLCEFYGLIANLYEPIVLYENNDVKFRFAKTIGIVPITHNDSYTFLVLQEKVERRRTFAF